MRKRRIYILPTKFGLVFITGAAVMVLIGAAYQNNLVNMLAFFMLSLIFVTMIQTHFNLKDIDVAAMETLGGFEGTEYIVTTVLANPAKGARFNIEADLRKAKPIAIYDNVLPLTSENNIKLRSAYPTPRRGRYQINEVKIHSAYPTGLFRAWMWLDTKSTYFIYPQAKGERALPGDRTAEESGNNIGTSRGGEDYHGHRRFADGDSQRRVDWKAYARGRPLLIKEFIDGPPGTIYLDWNQLLGLDDEAKLQQMSSWIEKAKTKGLLYSVSLPDRRPLLGQGVAHTTACLEMLAELATELDAKRASK